MKVILLVPLAVMIALAALVIWLKPVLSPPDQASFDVAQLLGGDSDSEFSKASRPGAIEFPRDLGAQPSYRNGWWYYTGNLRSQSGRRFGFQLTFFRYALRPDLKGSGTGWDSGQIYMAHFAITDGEGIGHESVERFSRPAAGLAGTRNQPFRVWLEDWQAQSMGESFLPQTLQAEDPISGISLDLFLGPGRGPWLQGEQGLSVKGPEPGNASYYFSYTRIPTRGKIQVAGEIHTVEGLTWFDREWSTSSLGAGLVGWDWFALHLDDGRDLMFYSLREQGGTSSPFSAGRVMAEDGAHIALNNEQVRLKPTKWWTSPRTRASYPVAWALNVPSLDLDLQIRATLADQEQPLSVVYWEGSVEVVDRASGEINGSGYLEMTGYESALGK